jgi:hypothetical protein
MSAFNYNQKPTFLTQTMKPHTSQLMSPSRTHLLLQHHFHQTTLFQQTQHIRSMMKVQSINSMFHTHMPYSRTTLCSYLDHLGGLGPFATTFFFGTSTKIPASAPFPTWSPQTFPHNPDAYLLYKRTITLCPKDIFNQATHNWHAGIHTPRPFGNTYHTATPYSWGLQTFGLNLIKGLATHCNNALQKLLHHEQSRRPIYNQLNNLHSPYPTHALLRVSEHAISHQTT